MIHTTINNLKKHHFNVMFFNNVSECREYIKKRLSSAHSVAAGGSMTLTDTGIREIIENEAKHFIIRDGSGEEGKLRTEREALTADLYFAGINAIAGTGEIINIDKRGNRVGAITFGPREVILVSGTNKICQSHDDAMNRARNIAAVKNCERFDLNTPCRSAGKCVQCEHENNICYTTVIMRMCYPHKRITVCLIDGDYGY